MIEYPQGPQNTQPTFGRPTGYQEYPPTAQPQPPYWTQAGQPTGAVPTYPYTQAPMQPQAAGPAGGASPNGPQVATRRAVWRYPAGALVLMLMLLASFLIGHAVVTPGTTSTTNSSTSSVASSSAQDLQQTVINVVQKVQPSVVEVTSRGASKEAIGSGVILTQDGYIVTNDHVVSGFTSFTVTLSNGQSQQARLVGESPQHDLAVLKIAASNLQPITFADSSKVEVGQFAIAVGSPLGLENSATLGIVSALNRTASEQPEGPAAQLTGLIQTSAGLNPGNSGGALVDLQGQLIGIPTLGVSDSQTNSAANDIGLVIPANQVKQIADQLIQQGG